MDADGADRSGLVSRLLDQVAEFGAAAQACVPGLYAWAVTVAPAAWSKGASWPPKVLAIAGLVCLLGALPLEGRRPPLARAVSVWGLTATSGLVWVLASASLGPSKIDPIRSVAGMFGWGLFALAIAAPTLKRLPRPPGERRGSLRPRSEIPRGDLAFILGGTLLAVALQLVGWRTTGAERLLLVRLAAVAAGLGVIGAATSIALARHVRRAPRSPRSRLRSAWLPIALLAILLCAGLLWVLR